MMAIMTAVLTAIVCLLVERNAYMSVIELRCLWHGLLTTSKRRLCCCLALSVPVVKSNVEMDLHDLGLNFYPVESDP